MDLDGGILPAPILGGLSPVRPGVFFCGPSRLLVLLNCSYTIKRIGGQVTNILEIDKSLSWSKL